MRAIGRRAAAQAVAFGQNVTPYPAYMARWLDDVAHAEGLYTTVKLFHACPHPMIVKDARSVFVAVNRAFQRATGRTPRMVEGLHAEQIIGGCLAMEGTVRDQRLLLTREPFTVPGVLPTRDHRLIRVRTLRIPWALKRGLPGLALVMLPAEACEDRDGGDER